MRSWTHGLISVTVVAAGIGTANPAHLALAAIASQLPDLDTTTSWPGRIGRPLARWIEQRYPHRTVTHSFLASCLVAVGALPLAFWGMDAYLSVVLGFTAGWFADAFTKQGVSAFWPSTARLVVPANPSLRLSTNSKVEVLIILAATMLLVFVLNINSQGGLLKWVNLTAGFPQGAVEIVNELGSDYFLWADIEGLSPATQQPIKGRFEVIRALTQTDLLVMDDKGIPYRAGRTQESQILANRVRIHKAGRITQETLQLSMDSDSFDDILLQLPQAPRIFISGQVKLDDPEVTVLTADSRYPSIRKSLDGTLILESVLPQEIGEKIRDETATGILLARIVRW